MAIPNIIAMHKHIPQNDEISLFHNPNCSKAKKALVYAKSIARSVSDFEFSKSAKTATQWKNILTSLGKKPKDILDKSKPYYQTNLRGRDFIDDDWLNVVMNNPELIRSPIAIKGNKALFLDNPSDILRI